LCDGTREAWIFSSGRRALLIKELHF